MPWCTYCGQSFTRDEHLERHILTHTNVKPYKCPNCFMSFARRDLLQRHFLVHGRESDQNDDPNGTRNDLMPRSAGRTPIACHNCAKTKTKCDKKFPCSRCASRNLTCTARPTRRSTKKVRPLEHIVAPGHVAPDDTADQLDNPAVAAAAAEPPPPSSAAAESSDPQGSSGSSSSSKSASDSSDLHQQTPDTDSSKGLSESPATSRTESRQARTDSSASLPLTNDAMLPGSASTNDLDNFMFGNAFSENTSPEDILYSSTFAFDWPQMDMATAPPLIDAFDQTKTDSMLISSPPFLDTSMLAPNPYNQPDNIFLSPFTPQDAFAPSVNCYLQPEYQYSPLQNNTLHPSELSGGGAKEMLVSLNTSNFAGKFDAITSGYDAWSAFRCVPFKESRFCPKTAKLNLEQLEQSLKDHSVWAGFQPLSWDSSLNRGNSVSNLVEIPSMQEATRDKLLAMTQAILHKAFEVHGGEHGVSSKFIVLPPSRVLEHFIESYTMTFEQFYPLTASASLSVNHLILNENEDSKATSLLTLLIIAQGALATPSTDTCALSCGLTEACRTTLFDLIEKNMFMATDATVLHAALLFTCLAAWSGDKWQMDLATGQGKMYFEMLRHSGLTEGLQSQQEMCMTSLGNQMDADTLWQCWISQERCHRLVYCWAMLDQEMSLFHDTAPILSVREFGAPLPHSEQIWRAKSAQQFYSRHEKMQGFSASSPLGLEWPESLRDLFSRFLDDSNMLLASKLTALHLRLLLHPLQSLIFQHRQLISCLSTSSSTNSSSSTSPSSPHVNNGVSFAMTANSRMVEVRTLLQRWYGLADMHLRVNSMCPLMQSALAIFHLISLDAVTNFPEIESLARRRSTSSSAFSSSSSSLFSQDASATSWARQSHPSQAGNNCIADVEEAVFHAGQAVRVVRSMPRGVRPSWWPAAIYRAALVLWCDSVTQNDVAAITGMAYGKGGDGTFAIDALTPDHPAVARYLSQRQGTPVLTRQDGSLLRIDADGSMLLQHFCEVLDEGVRTRFVDGIASKLDRLSRS